MKKQFAATILAAFSFSVGAQDFLDARVEATRIQLQEARLDSQKANLPSKALIAFGSAVSPSQAVLRARAAGLVVRELHTGVGDMSIAIPIDSSAPLKEVLRQLEDNVLDVAANIASLSESSLSDPSIDQGSAEFLEADRRNAKEMIGKIEASPESIGLTGIIAEGTRETLLAMSEDPVMPVVFVQLLGADGRVPFAPTQAATPLEQRD